VTTVDKKVSDRQRLREYEVLIKHFLTCKCIDTCALPITIWYVHTGPHNSIVNLTVNLGDVEANVAFTAAAMITI